MNTISGEDGVDIVAENVVVDHVFGISRGSVLLSKGIKLLFGQVEVQHGQDLFKLVLGDSSLSKFIEIIEELLDSNSLHDDLCLKSLFDVKWAIGGFNSLLHETVINDIKSRSRVVEIGSSCISQLTVVEWFFLNCLLWNVLWEHVLWMINIVAEFEIVDLSDITFIEVLSDQELVRSLVWWDKLQLLHNSSKLLSGNMAAIGSVIVLELWLDKNSFVHYFGFDGHQKYVELIHIVLIEIGGALGTKDDSVSCRWVFENVVDVLTKLRIVDESWTIWLLILGQKCLNFALMELNVESSKACTELNFEKMKRSEYGSKLYDKCSVP